MDLYKLFTLLLFSFTTFSASAEHNWPMAGGPDGDWTVTGPQPPLNFSVRTKHNILWKTSLPEGGQSGIAIHGELAFLSIMKPWTPKHDPDELKAELKNINQQKTQIRDTVDRELLDSNTDLQLLTHITKITTSKSPNLSVNGSRCYWVKIQSKTSLN